ncbi:MAG: hypothetical protein NZ529_05945 [Cytophagaceae bacterium]|nr:hypothetical protein [Cytophagaceae bacterium]MDW8456320.1 hypothetical protein [Cytophagaceae bacterium]
MYKKKTLAYSALISIIIACTHVRAQQTAEKKCKWIHTFHQPVSIDSLSLVPSSLYISSVPDTLWSISYNPQNNTITLTNLRSDTFVMPDSVLVCYTTFPVLLHKPYYRRDIRLYDSTSTYVDPRYRNNTQPIDKREELFSSPGIHKTGTISRGISLGNNQSVFVNSALNLQMEGRLTDDVSITAVISDQNIPFQPDGNTQQLQEFDKVYVQLKGKNTSLTAGDLVMKNIPNEYLRYYRNVQGAQGEYLYKKDSSFTTHTIAGISISKGKFNSMTFGYGQSDSLIEGVQGPYRLRGPNNERFIIVLANSEKVYLDGKLLTRGWDYDYIIDYNQAEITFTNNVVITKFSRVRVDFEFSDRNFSRTITNVSQIIETKKNKSFVSFYMEKDNPNNPLTISLTDEDKQSLSLIGDTLNKAFISGADSIGFSENKILYKKIFISGKPVYVYSTHPDSAFYEVKFSQVAPGNAGSYVLLNSTANGRIFSYVGYPFGNYEPVQVVPTPKQKQMLAAGISNRIGKYNEIYGEIAFSKEDKNLYSKFDSYDDYGLSYKTGMKNSGTPIYNMKGYRWTHEIHYEFNHLYFSPIDRFRAADFERDWNEDANYRANNVALSVLGGIVKNEHNKIQHSYTRRQKGTDVNGVQHHSVFNTSFKNAYITSSFFFMDNQKNIGNASWRKLYVNPHYKTRYIIPGVTYQTERNLITDTLRRASGSLMYYEEYKAYIKNADSSKFTFYTDYSQRRDKEVYNGALHPNAIAYTTNTGIYGNINSNNRIGSAFTYRFLNNNIGPTPLDNEETVMGKGEWNAYLLKRHISSEILITSATGRELKREFVYLPVATGLGTHVWIDYDNDGKQDLNEFSEKIFDDPNGEYIKAFVPTDVYTKAFSNTFNYRADASAPRKWRNSEMRIKRFASKFSTVSSWVVNKKITDPSLASRFLPTINNLPDTSIIALQRQIRSSLFFNRADPSYGLEFGFLANESKQFLTQGFERKIQEEYSLLCRKNLFKNYFNLKLILSSGTRANQSDFLKTRNYNISILKISPAIAAQPKNTYRITLLGGYTDKINILRPSRLESARLIESGVELKVNKAVKRTINVLFKYIRIYISDSLNINTPAGYEMAEALQSGSNFTWNAIWQEKLSNGLQISFSYEGRKSPESRTIHIGRMQVSALF